MLRRTFLALSCLAMGPVQIVHGATPFPSWSEVSRVVRDHLASTKGYATGDLISQKEVTPLFAQLKTIGWQVSDEQEIVAKVLPESHFLVKQMRDRWGPTLMRRVSSQRLIYDKLDRISQADGGQTLINDIPKLPDAEKAIRYLPDLLPKKVGGRTRQVSAYDKPTGFIYTEKSLLERLEVSYRTAALKQPPQ